MIGTEHYPGKTGAKRQSYAASNPRDVLLKVVKRADDEEDARHKCWGIVSKNPSLIRTIYEYWFANNYRQTVHEATTGSRLKHPRRTKAEIAADVARIRAGIEQHVERQVAIRLLDMVMPSGKPLSASSREELLVVGGWTMRVADRLQPGQTVTDAGLTEDDLRELYQ